MIAKLIGPSSWEDANEDLGDLLIAVPRPPVSLQANAAARAALTESVRSATRHSPFVITTDVTVDIEWFVSERERYETDATADVDNIIKPILDALSGPQGVLVNDCQVQAIACYWMDGVMRDQQFHIRIGTRFGKFRCNKECLQFAQLGRGLCFPVDGSLPGRVQLTLLRHIEQMVAERDRLLEEGFDSGYARMMLPVQRLFHRTRVAGFPVVQLADLYRQLEENLAKAQDSEEPD